MPAKVPPSRPAWIEIDLDRLRHNYEILLRHKPDEVKLMAVVKDDAYGHGAFQVARVALECGADALGVSTLDEALMLRERFPQATILLLGERAPDELPWCLEHRIQLCASDLDSFRHLDALAAAHRQPAHVHLKVDTGMSRYGVRWSQAPALLRSVRELPWIRLEGVMSHFAQSDEADKTFALRQCQRFREVLSFMDEMKMTPPLRHLCNSGGFLDLPEAHFDMVRCGILPLGVYPSKVCRRLPGIEPVMQVKSRLAAIQSIQSGDTVGYGMRWKAASPRRIGVVPVGYGDGLPRLRNTGWVLVQGRRAPIVGANAMDATMVDLTELAQVRRWDEVILMGCQGTEEISVHDLAAWGQTVSYDVLTGWRSRLPRHYPGQPS